ncbi:MAG TPA: T9SS type A sorting domain-containing protein, partial [Bacteroidetes bacterium]|nr:T9SS type A sorting domain-containing protein [Bacteroidota bacterium]
DGDELSYEIASGIEELNLNIDGETHILTLEPALNYCGESEVLITADDGQDDGDGRFMSPMTDRFREVSGSPTDERPAYRFLRSMRDALSRPLPQRDLSAELRFTVTVLAVNDEPVWEETPEDSLTYAVYDDVTFELTASDVDEADELTIEFVDRGGLPEAAGLEDRGDGVALFDWMPTIDDMGEYNPVFSVSDGEAVVELELTFFIGNEREQVVFLHEGWSLMSINVSPGEEYYIEGEDRGPDCGLMLEALRNDEGEQLFLILKDNRGDFCSVRWGYYGIRYWNLQEGYWIKTAADWDAHWSGEPIAPDEPIDIAEGWSVIPYYPAYELPADCESDFYAFSPIIDNVIRIKNGYGEFLAPEFGFSNMRPCAPGMGFQISLDEDVTFEYPEPLNQDAVAATVIPRADHWSAPVSTGENMSVLITAFRGIEAVDGDQVAAFSEGSGDLVGVGTVVNSVCGLAVWGDDPYTETMDGLVEGDGFRLRWWDQEMNTELNLVPGGYVQGVDLVYVQNGFVALTVTAEAMIPEKYFLSQNYPNPFNAVTSIEYALPVSSHVKLAVYDISGRIVGTLVDDDLSAGRYSCGFDGSELAAGLYFIRLEAGSNVLTRKVVVVK